MLLCDESDVEQRLRRAVTTVEGEYLSGLIEEASELVVAHCGRNRSYTPVPDAVRLVTSRMVARVLDAPREGTNVESAQATAGPFQWSQRYTAESRTGGPWLTSADRKTLRGMRPWAFSVRTW
ncbi:hypothetical protein NN4_64930 [Nocardia ninae NBRC 108245]|uniref:Phage protein n=1 Tax=Nocardia ninae NBRC 108245 TaxID=1210091 RepID=A0A511MMX1_9NOCA|nr:hypothetical protein NN4_64930 [Nocardia ninae NBRC 108245]